MDTLRRQESRIQDGSTKEAEKVEMKTGMLDNLFCAKRGLKDMVG